jgi:poly-gamma-glutamate synthase PgsB/CapB
VITGVCVFVYLIYLFIERAYLGRRLGRIPLRISVTGTRGKSSVVRLIAACLRDSRMLVFAKTTGAKPCLIFPDGKEKEILRQGIPTILEEKNVLKEASRTGAHAVVLEMMSIRPETLHAESIQITKPHIFVITNIREDHVNEMGRSRDEIAGCFAAAIPKKSTVFIPEEEWYPVIQEKAEAAGAELILVPPGLSVDEKIKEDKMPASAFEQDFRLALAVVDFFGKNKDEAYRAAVRAAPDFGSLRVWKAGKDSPARGWSFVSAFAANDPESTKEVLVRLEKSGFFEGRKRIALLSLRKDRGGRTMQWFDALQDERTFAFDRLVFVGEHAQALKNRLQKRIKPEITVFKGKKPEDLIAQIATLENHEAVVFGMGNMGGVGHALVDFWEIAGHRHDL